MILALSLVELAQIIDAKIDTKNLDLDPDSIIIDSLRSLEQAKENHVAFALDQESNALFDLERLSLIKRSAAGWTVASKKHVEGKNYLLVANPLEALEKLQLFLTKKEQSLKDQYRIEWPHAFISIDAIIELGVIIEPGVVIKQGVFIGKKSIIKAYAYIDSAVHIGSYCIIGPHVVIHAQSSIKNHVIIEAHATIGGDGYGYQASQSGIKKIPHMGNLLIEDYVEIGASTTIDRALFDSTIIGTHSKIDNQVYIAHNVVIGAYTFILAQVVIGGSSKIGSFCKIGAQTGIKDHITIGDHVQIVGKSGILANIPSHSTVAGYPAHSILDWKKQTIALTKLPYLLKKLVLKKTDEILP